MANRAYLLSSKSADPQALDQSTCLLEATYAIPLFWMALFSHDDLINLATDETSAAIPYLATTVAHAKQRFVARNSCLLQYFVNVESYIPQWQQLLSLVTDPYLCGQVAEIVAMTEGDERTVANALAFFEKPNELTLNALLRVSGLRDYYNPEQRTLRTDPVVHYLINGVKTAAWVPWRDPDEKTQSRQSVTAIIGAPQNKPWWKFW